jgi:hypothetical protein
MATMVTLRVLETPPPPSTVKGMKGIFYTAKTFTF